MRDLDRLREDQQIARGQKVNDQRKIFPETVAHLHFGCVDRIMQLLKCSPRGGALIGHRTTISSFNQTAELIPVPVRVRVPVPVSIPGRTIHLRLRTRIGVF